VYKRGPYEHHEDNLLKLEPIFKILQISPRITGFMDALARGTSISRSTLSTWKVNLLANPSWRPMRIHCSFPQRAFTDEQDRELATGIAVSSIEKGLFYTDAHFKIDAIKFYQKIETAAAEETRSIQSLEAAQSFAASPRFIQNFRHRNRPTLRRPSFKRRPRTTAQQIEEVTQRVQELLVKYSRSRIINIDGQKWCRKVSKPLPSGGRLSLSLFPLAAPTSFNHSIAAYLVS
jgi:hypothetical protein